MSDQLKHGTHRNRHAKLRTDAYAGMDRRWELHLERAGKAAALSRLVGHTADERELRKRLTESRLRAAGADDALLGRIRDQRAHRAKQLAGELAHLGTPYQAPHPLPDPPHVLDDPAGSGELWWAQTNWSWNDPGITPFWDDSAGLRFAGEIGDPLDVYMRRNLTAVAQFGLGADRVPADLLGTVVSAPRANVFGAVRGMTLAGLWDFGDQWCKCWLNLRQTVWVEIPGLNIPIFGDRLPFGTNTSVITLIYLDGDGYADNFFPGPIGLPVVQFPLQAGWSVEVDLEFWFDIQLEGDNTDIIFGNNAEFQSNLIQTFQWSLTRA